MINKNTVVFSRDFAYDEPNLVEYKKLIWEDGTGYEGSPFKGKTYADVFLCSMALGYNKKMRKSFARKKNYIKLSAVEKRGRNLILSVAISETKDLGILYDINKIYEIVEEYANGGLVELIRIIDNQNNIGSPIMRMQEIIFKELDKIENHTSTELSSNLVKQIKGGENSTIEFKSTFKFDLNRFSTTGTRATNKEVEKVVSKTIAAFMNADGGQLFIGIGDEGEILGLENDYEGLEKPYPDKFRLSLKNSLQKYLGDKIIFDYTKIDMYTIDGKDVCVITVSPKYDKPAIIYDNDNRGECYVRVDNESKLYNYGEFHDYFERRKQKNRNKLE